MLDGEFIPQVNGASYPTVAYATDERMYHLKPVG